MALTYNRCGKKLSRKTARQIGSEIMCSGCLFGREGGAGCRNRTGFISLEG